MLQLRRNRVVMALQTPQPPSIALNINAAQSYLNFKWMCNTATLLPPLICLVVSQKMSGRSMTRTGKIIDASTMTNTGRSAAIAFMGHSSEKRPPSRSGPVGKNRTAPARRRSVYHQAVNHRNASGQTDSAKNLEVSTNAAVGAFVTTALWSWKQTETLGSELVPVNDLRCALARLRIKLNLHGIGQTEPPAADFTQWFAGRPRNGVVDL